MIDPPKRSGNQSLRKADRMARIDFGRMYTVEHNVKVLDFGNVHTSHLGRLQSQWILTITGGRRSAVTGRLANLGAEPSLGDGEDDEGGGEYDEGEEHEE